MPSVTIDRIDALRRHIADAVTRTSPDSTLPEPEQDRMLQQACSEACELLGDWLESQPGPSPGIRDVPVRELLRDQQQFADFLGPLFADAMERTRASVTRLADERAGGSAGRTKAERDVTVRAAHEEVTRAVRAAAATARRYPRMQAGQLFRVATDKVVELQKEVCDLAAKLRGARADGEARDRRLRQRVRKILPRVGASLLSIAVSTAVSIVLGTAGPQAVVQNAAGWAHGTPVVMAHHLAAAAAPPGVSVAPPHTGLQPR